MPTATPPSTRRAAGGCGAAVSAVDPRIRSPRHAHDRDDVEQHRRAPPAPAAMAMLRAARRRCRSNRATFLGRHAAAAPAGRSAARRTARTDRAARSGSRPWPARRWSGCARSRPAVAQHGQRVARGTSRPAPAATDAVDPARRSRPASGARPSGTQQQRVDQHLPLGLARARRPPAASARRRARSRHCDRAPAPRNAAASRGR